MSTIDEIKKAIQILQNGGKIAKITDLYNAKGEKVGKLEIYPNKVDEVNNEYYESNRN